MNQHQRKFLLDQIERQYKAELEALKERKPEEPSLNNYLTAAILDGTAVMKDLKEVRAAIRDRVRDLGKGESLVESADRWSDEEVDTIKLPALLLFEAPEKYAEVYSRYVSAKGAWEQELKDLEASINAMRIKVQVGSDKALEVLVEQADKLCSMSLTASSRLLLPAP